MLVIDGERLASTIYLDTAPHRIYQYMVNNIIWYRSLEKRRVKKRKSIVLWHSSANTYIETSTTIASASTEYRLTFEQKERKIPQKRKKAGTIRREKGK